jgi:hypothetical protein
LSLLSARVNDLMPSVFPAYSTLRRRPFTFEGQRRELVQDASAKSSANHNLLQHFTIRPKIAMECRLLEPVQGELGLVLTLTIATKWSIGAGLESLQRAGIDLNGLYAVRRSPVDGQRRLLGRIESVSETRVHFSETLENHGSIHPSEVCLEGSRASFDRCLKVLLGSQFAAFDEARERAEATLTTGPAQRDALVKFADALRKRMPLQIVPGVSCSVGSQIEFRASGPQASAWPGEAVDYCFDAAKTKRKRVAWPGLEEFGPFDRESFSRRSPRVLVVSPDASQGTAEQFVRALVDGVQSISPSRYSQGFARLFGLTKPTFDVLPVPVTKGTDGVHTMYRSALESHLARKSDYEAAIVVVDDRHADAPDVVNPYLHAKALLLMSGIPVQEIRRSTMCKPASTLQYILQNFAIALYAKMGGTPWTIAHDQTVTDELVMGLGSCELSGSRLEQRQRYVGITTVFRGDGNYLLANVARACPYQEYGGVLRQSTRSVLGEVKVRNGWQPGDRVRIVVHSFKPLRNVEIAEIMSDAVREVAGEQTVEFAFLNVVEDHPFKLLDLQQLGKQTKGGGKKAELVPERGISTQLGRSTRLLCMNGPSLIKRDVSPLPSPVLLHLHPSSTYVDQTYLTEQALKFSSLSWRSTLPAYQPVTIYYSSLIASLLARLEKVSDWSPAVLNTKLRSSRWFL